MLKKISVITLLLHLFTFSYQTSFVYAQTIDGGAIKADIISDVNSKTNNLKTTIINNATSSSSPTQQTEQPQSSTDVVNSGNSVTVASDNNSNTDIEVNNNNTAQVNQHVDASANTGKNDASYNISIGGNAGMITTGNATVSVTQEAIVNNNSVGVVSGSPSSSSNTNLTNTGNGVHTSSNTTGTTSVYVNNNNTAVIHQATNAQANTGDNRAVGNISIGGISGQILTGDASVGVSYLIAANGNVALIGGTGGNGPGTGASIYIANAGNRFDSAIYTNTSRYIVVNNRNRALISQMCGMPGNELGYLVDVSACIARTGGNVSSGNIAFGADAGVITTGDATVNVTYVTRVNENITEIEIDGGTTNSSTSVTNTGNNVGVDVTTNNSTGITVNNTNDAEINQSVRAVADTGNNTANRNISIGGNAGIITTGDATVNVYLRAEANNSTTVIKDPSAGLSGDPKSTVNVINTGNDVTINSSVNRRLVITVNNDNNLQSHQIANVYANTGGNIASGNVSICCHEGDSQPTPTTAPQPTSSPQITTTPKVTDSPKKEEPKTHTIEIASATKSTDDTDDKEKGDVLGAATASLPSTGPQNNILLVVMCVTLLAVGLRLRNVTLADQR